VEAGGTANGTAGSDGTGNVLTNDTDPDSVVNGEARTVSALRTGTEAGSGTAGAVGAALAGTFGSLTLNADGSYTYVVDETNTAVQALRVTGQQLTDVFTYTMQDAGGLSDLAQLTLTIDGRNDAPVALDDTGSAVEAGGTANGTAGSDGTGNVLTNDTDPDSVVNGEARTVSALRTGTEAGSGTAGVCGSRTGWHLRQPDAERGRQLHLRRRRDQYRGAGLARDRATTHRRVHLHDAGRRRPVRPGATDTHDRRPQRRTGGAGRHGQRRGGGRHGERDGRQRRDRQRADQRHRPGQRGQRRGTHGVGAAHRHRGGQRYCRRLWEPHWLAPSAA
jgi:VCBS repeat-containing protein